MQLSKYCSATTSVRVHALMILGVVQSVQRMTVGYKRINSFYFFHNTSY